MKPNVLLIVFLMQSFLSFSQDINEINKNHKKIAAANIYSFKHYDFDMKFFYEARLNNKNR